MSEQSHLRDALLQVQRGLDVAKLGLDRNGVQHQKIVKLEGIVAEALAAPLRAPADALAGEEPKWIDRLRGELSYVMDDSEDGSGPGNPEHDNMVEQALLSVREIVEPLIAAVTPAMSAETVPSEEFVLVPREPTPAMVDAGRIYGWDDPEHEASCIGHPETRESIYRAMIAAAPALSDRPPAKEVDGKAVVPYDDFHAAYQFVPRSKMSPDHCLKTRLRSLLREEDLAHVDEAEVLASPTLSASHLAKEGGEAGAGELRKFAESFKFTVTDSFYSDAYLTINEPDSANFRLGTGSQFSKFIAALEARRVVALASLPQSSPARAEGGDASREAPGRWSFDDGAIGWFPGGRSSLSTRIIARPPGLVNHQWYNLARDVCAALSTPTEGPASQTEGKGGDRDFVKAAIQTPPIEIPADVMETASEVVDRYIYDWNAAGGDHSVTAIFIACRAIMAHQLRTALTPPETAEAVPVAGEPTESGTIFPKLEDTARLREELERVTRERDNARRREKEMAGEKDAAFAELAVVVKALETVREDERDRLYEEAMAQMSSISSRSFASGAFYWLEEEYGALLPADRAAARSASSQGGETDA